MLLDQKVAIITGGSRGIGEAIADLFSEHGASVVVVATDSEMGRLQSVCERAHRRGQKAIPVSGDVSIPSLACQAVEAAKKEFGRLDILVNCAGIVTRSPFSELTVEEWNSVLDVNLTGAFHLCQRAIPEMLRQRAGSIINMSSQMARIPHPSASPSYEASKAGLNALTRHLALHYAAEGIRVNAIAPGSINTDMPKSMGNSARECLRQSIPMKRLGEPAEVANVALFLSSEMSSYMTGSVLSVTGGHLMD